MGLNRIVTRPLFNRYRSLEGASVLKHAATIKHRQLQKVYLIKYGACSLNLRKTILFETKDNDFFPIG